MANYLIDCTGRRLYYTFVADGGCHLIHAVSDLFEIFGSGKGQCFLLVEAFVRQQSHPVWICFALGTYYLDLCLLMDYVYYFSPSQFIYFVHISLIIFIC